MKKVFAIVCLMVTVLSTGCKKSTVAANIPACIKSEIENNKDRSDWSIGSVEEYRFQGKLVYAFIPDNRLIADG